MGYLLLTDSPLCSYHKKITGDISRDGLPCALKELQK